MSQTAFEIYVQGTEIRFPCKPDEFILEAMRRSGRGPVHYGCFGGGCGVCKMKILSGDYRVEKKLSRAHVSPEEQETGITLLCCVKPQGDLIIAEV